jgi:hypothetical protein
MASPAGASSRPTLTIDDPAISDEASLPTIQYQRHGTDDGGAAFRETDIAAEYDKRNVSRARLL